MRRFATAAFVLVAGSALAGAPTPIPAAKYSIRIKVVDKSGTTFVPIAEVSRAGDKVATKALAAPAIDKLADELEQRWNAFKPPASVTVTEHLASDTGMNPQYHPYSATFTAKDGLYRAAVVKTFVESYGYSMLGLSDVHYIIYDASPESPPGANDRASTHSNFRKNIGGIQYDANGHDTVFLSVRVRPQPAPGATDKRVSGTDPTLAVGHPYDEGTVQIGWLDLVQDGSITFHKTYPGQQFVDWFKFQPEDTNVSVIEKDEYKQLKVKKDSPWNLEAQLVNQWEMRSHYDVAPVIDPVVFR